MSKTTSAAIRLSLTPEVKAALSRAKKHYPALSDPEILKLGLSKIITDNQKQNDVAEIAEIRAQAAYAMGEDYLTDPTEDIYRAGKGKLTHFE